MRKEILKRYARLKSGTVLIDVQANRIRDLYHDFDRTAPYVRRDLDPQLVDYLIDSARELGGMDYRIRIQLSDRIEDIPESRIRKSFENYFIYLKGLQQREMRTMVRNSLILLTTGIVILIAAVWTNEMQGEAMSVPGRVFAEGLTVAAWVAMWEALANFLLHWVPHRKLVRLYGRLAAAPLEVLSNPL